MKRILPLVLAAFVMAGCETGTREIKAEPDPRIDELAAENVRLAKRLDELGKVVLDLQDALRKQATSGGPARAGEAEPAKGREPEAIKVENVPPPAVPVEEVPKSSGATAVKEEPPVAAKGREGFEPPAGTDPAALLFRKAYVAYREGSLGRAMLDFEEFIAKYPRNEYADDAQYLIGELFMSDGKYAEAIVEFNRVVTRYPTEQKASEALYMIGECYAKLGQKDNAKASFVRLLSEYPASEAAYRAKRKLDNP